jgi:excisionase family DNA binding protein
VIAEALPRMADSLDTLFEGLPVRLTVAQLTEVLGLSSTTVTYRWLRDGRVPAIQLGSYWLILRDDVKEHLRAHYNVAPGRELEVGNTE